MFMDILLDGKRLGLKEVLHDINLMAQERVISQFLRDDRLAWFVHYHPTDVQRLETILSQARAQYPILPDNERQFVDTLGEFYQDFRSFDWERYQRLLQEQDTANRLGYEAETALRWGKRLRSLLGTIEPLELLLQATVTKYKKSPYGIGRPATFECTVREK